MKLWIVIYIFGKVAMTVGPLPYDMNECEVRSAQKYEELDETFKKNGGVIPPMGGIAKEVHREDVRIECVKSKDRPEADWMMGSAP